MIYVCDIRRADKEHRKLTKLMENMDWDLFVRQKEWLYSQQVQIEKWYGCEAAALPTGILNMMDRIQDAWEETRDDTNHCWYEERWYDEDIAAALEAAGVMVTEDNVTELKARCIHIFDDKSERNEMLVSMAREYDIENLKPRRKSIHQQTEKADHD